MPYEPTRGVYRYIDEELDVPHQTSGHRPKQQLPQRNYADRQAEIEAQARKRNFQGGRGMTPDSLPRVRQRPAQDDDELYADDDLYTRMPRSARYRPQEIYNDGDTSVYAGELSIPKRRSSHQQQLPPARQNERNAGEFDEQVPERPRQRRRPTIRFHALFWLGIGMIVMVLLWAGFSNLITWWNIHQDDSTYGRPRTFQIDAVVGHNDSAQNPSHFIAVNLNRHIVVIEIPGETAVNHAFTLSRRSLATERSLPPLPYHSKA